MYTQFYTILVKEFLPSYLLHMGKVNFVSTPPMPRFNSQPSQLGSHGYKLAYLGIGGLGMKLGKGIGPIEVE